MENTRTIYLDHAATTPLDGRVLEAMLPYLQHEYGNASSPHGLGRRARFAVEDARERIAAHIGAEVSEVIFTSGGTEANNLALWTLAQEGRKHLAATRAEHESVLESLRAIRETGVPVSMLRPNNAGTIDLSSFAGGPNNRPSAVSVMHTNNETGALSPLAAVAASCKNEGMLLHSDCVQSLGWADLNVDKLGVDLMTLSAHKIYGPKGVGVLFVRAGAVELKPFIRGGSQERRRRGGTENVASIVGMAAAMDLAAAERKHRFDRLRATKLRLLDNLNQSCSGEFIVNTPPESAPHILNLSFPPRDGVPLDGEMLLLNLDVAGIHVSSGSACTSGALEPSHVLLAMGVSETTAAATIRFSFGIANEPEDMDHVSEQLSGILRRMRMRVG